MSCRPAVTHEIISAINHNQINEMYSGHRKVSRAWWTSSCFSALLIRLKILMVVLWMNDLVSSRALLEFPINRTVLQEMLLNPMYSNKHLQKNKNKKQKGRLHTTVTSSISFFPKVKHGLE